MLRQNESNLPLVSVIIPNHNHARYIGDAIASVLAQEYTNVEVIVVDDGSTDDSQQVVAQFGTRVRYLYQHNAGLSAARNKGIREAAGSLIGVLDADDMYEPSYLRTLVPALMECSDADGIYCGYQFVDSRNNPLPQVEARKIPPDRLYTALLDGNFLVPESMLLRRYVYENVGLFDEALRACEDWDVWLRIAKGYKIIHTTNVLTRHRVLPGSMSTDPQRMLTARLAVLEKHLGPEPAGGGASIGHRAYGYAYLGSCVEYLQTGNVDRSSETLKKMAQVCPTLLTEGEIHYQLGCGEQSKGYMGNLTTLNIMKSSSQLLDLMARLFSDPDIRWDVKSLERSAFSMARYILGLLSYSVRDFRRARMFFWQAAIRQPHLLLEPRFTFTWLKAMLSPVMIDALRSWRRHEIGVFQGHRNRK